MLACTLYIIHQIENRILVPFRNHFIYFCIYCIIHSLQFPRYILIISIIFSMTHSPIHIKKYHGSITISDESIIIWAFG